MRSPRSTARRLRAACVLVAAVGLTVVGVQTFSANASPTPAASAKAGPLPVAPDGHSHPVIESVPADQPARGLVYKGLNIAQTGPCKGTYLVRGHDVCSHGPDQPPPGYRMGTDVQPLSAQQATAAGVCVGDGTSGNRAQVLYVYASTDRFSQYKTSIEQWAIGMSDIYNESAKETGGTRHVRLLHDANCTPVVSKVQVTSSQLADFTSMSNALSQKGYNRQDRKYVIFADSSVYCGIGDFAGDTRKGATNRSNYGPSYGRTDTSCWGPDTPAHELGHNLGAVNNNAPNASGGAHCTDEWDLMCYSDSPNYPQMRYICTDQAKDARFDCGHNDYYHTNPPAGSYLATYWNMADSIWLVANGSTDPTPTPGVCSTYATKHTGTLNQGATAIQPNGTWYQSTTSGTHAGCVDGPDGTDFDLHLQKWNGSAWTTVAKAETDKADETLSYSGTAGYYQYKVVAYAGSGGYTFGMNKP